MEADVQVQQDERLGKPSASKMKRIRRCPGSVGLERRLPKRDDSTKDAAAGTERHSLIELGVDAATVEDSNESYVVGMSEKLRKDAIEKALGSLEGAEVHTEDRLWVYDDSLEPIYSAKLDWYAIKAGVALICDYKTLFGRHAHARENEQLAAQAVALFCTYDVNEVIVALIQPNLSAEERLTMAKFSRDDLIAAQEQVLGWCFAAENQHAPRIPGPVQCEHCPCRADCPEAIAAELALTIVDVKQLSEPQAMSVLLDRAELADKVVKAIREKAKRMLDEKIEIPGWGLEEGDEQRKITNAAVLAGVLADAGATPEQITAIAKIGVTDADKLYYQLRKAADGTTEKAAKAELEKKLLDAGAMEKSRKASSLTRKKQ